MNTYMVGYVDLFEGVIKMGQIQARNEVDAVSIYFGEGPGFYVESLEELKESFANGYQLIEVVKL